MPNVLTELEDWSITATSNEPNAGADPATLRSDLQQIQATVRKCLANKGSDIASASFSLVDTDGSYHDVTGTTAITAGGTVAAGISKLLKFEGALTFTHNATSWILPGGANITTANGDLALMVSEGSGNWRCVFYTKANGQAVVTSTPSGSITASGYTQNTARILGRTTAAAGAIEELTVGAGLTLSGGDLSANGITLGTSVATTSGTTADFNSIPAGVKQITISWVGVSTNSTSGLLIQIGDSGGIENTSYVSGSSSGAGGTTTANTAGFICATPITAATNQSGSYTITLVNASTNTWAGSGTSWRSDSVMSMSAGQKALSATLDRVRFTTVSGDTFDAGEVNIAYQ